MTPQPIHVHRRRSAAADLSAVVSGGFCVGCGACAATPGSTVTMALDAQARYRPQLPVPSMPAAAGAAAAAACPFLDGPDEDALAAHFGGGPGVAHDSRLGWYRGLYAGHAEGAHRASGSSGGITSWLLAELLRRGLVDGVVHVRASEATGGPRFVYDISTSPDMVAGNAKTRYYPVELSGVLQRVRATPGRYAFVGVPCFVKAVRRMAQAEPLLAERIVATVALFCGHMKSGRFADSLAWQMGVAPEAWSTVDFRRKLPDRPASAYGFAVRTPEGAGDSVAPMRDLVGYDWGMGVFRLSACDYCDDVVGEAADISFGDAWLPAYVHDSAGTNLVVVRDAGLHALLREGAARGALQLADCSLQDMVKSQEPSFRHRRAGLAYRLWLKDRRGQWRPPKRVAADPAAAPPIYRCIFRYRMFMSSSSHAVFGLAQRTGLLGLYTLYVRGLARINTLLVRLSRSRRFARLGAVPPPS